VTTKLHPLRVQGRAKAAEIGAEAQAARVDSGDAACTDRAIARRFCLSKSGAPVAAWFDPQSGHAVTLGDVLAMPRDLAREILARAFAALEGDEGPSAEASMGDLAITLGEIAADIRRDRADDGKVNDHRAHADNYARAVSVAMRAYAAEAKRAGGGK
jgi:hypothetical protein